MLIKVQALFSLYLTFTQSTEALSLSIPKLTCLDWPTDYIISSLSHPRHNEIMHANEIHTEFLAKPATKTVKT